jgi:hypothetical protein
MQEKLNAAYFLKAGLPVLQQYQIDSWPVAFSAWYDADLGDQCKLPPR